MPAAMSTAPTTGMSFHAQCSGIPTTPKYGTHAAFVVMPNAPWPMKHADAATRKHQ
jgi:hypothetical protein